MENDGDGVPLYPHAYPPHHKTEIAMSNTRPTHSAPPPPINPPLVLLGPDNTITTCPFCNASIKSAVRYTSNTRTHIAAALCSMICCCCCLPYCMDSAKNADHYCPNCQRYIGTYRR